jgi:hypothetical protein
MQAPQPSVAAASPADKERAYWDGVKDSKDASDFEAYLARFPDGTYADIARDRMARLRSNAAPAELQTADAGRGSETAQPAASQPAASQPAAAPAQVAALPPADEPPGPAPDGTIRLSNKVGGQLKSYLSQLNNRNGAFAASPDGRFAGSFICEAVGQCVAGKRGLPQNTDPRYPQKTALQKCKSASKQECVVIYVRDDEKQPFTLAGE